MTTIEKLGWIALGIAVIVFVASTLMQPILDKAKEQQTEIENIQFVTPDESTTFIDIDFKSYAKIKYEDDIKTV